MIVSHCIRLSSIKFESYWSKYHEVKNVLYKERKRLNYSNDGSSSPTELIMEPHVVLGYHYHTDSCNLYRSLLYVNIITFFIYCFNYNCSLCFTPGNNYAAEHYSVFLEMANCFFFQERIELSVHAFFLNKLNK